MEPSTSGTIAVRPPRNRQGGHYLLCLHTVKSILRINWTELPMTNEVVDSVRKLAAES